MPLSTEVLVAETERLVARAELAIRDGAGNASALRAEQELKRLRLYRAILISTNAAHALMPEYLVARGLLGEDQLPRRRPA